MRLSADRLTAARTLMRVEQGAFSSRLLASGGSPAVRVRVLETLRWLAALDAALAPHCRRDLDTLDPEVRAVLRLGLVEAMRLNVAPELATDGAVRLIRRMGCSSAAGMVNAVLRKAVAQWPQTIDSSGPSIRLSHPEWLGLRWVKNFGVEAAESAMESALRPAKTWVWFFDEENRHRLEGEGVALEPHPWCPDAWTAPSQAPLLVKVVANGGAYAQDPSSQIVAHAARALACEGARAVDLCAAPGGKSALMLRLGGWDCLVAADLQLKRARLIKPTLARVGEAMIAAADATRTPFAASSWDLILLDAPCSGTGTFRRHPELKWRLQPGSLNEIAANQRRLLNAALELAVPEGVVLYSTCSVEPEENEGVVADLPSGFAVEDLSPYLPEGVPWIPTEAGGARILPNADGDGFTLHAIRRK